MGVSTDRLGRTQPRWAVGLTGLLEFLDMTSEGWGELGGQDCFSVGCNICVLDLLDGFLQLLRPVSDLSR